MKCIAIDDEPLALEIIKTYCKKIEFISLAGAYINPMDAIMEIKLQNIDLIFLDLQMPNLTGFSFLKTLTNPPLVIIITAYPEHALTGFEVNAVDYLVKPFSFDRFLKAVTKAYQLSNLLRRNIPFSSSESDFLLIKADYKTVKIELDKILFIEGFKDYVKIYCGLKPILTKGTLKKFIDKLPISNFVRIHKSYIVSLSKVKSIENGRILLGETSIPIGDKFKEQFYKKLKSGML
jgi:DNA-binding LytR/AlgR family response regulator